MVVFTEAEHVPTLWPRSCTSRYVPSRKIYKIPSRRMFIAVLFIIAKSWKLHKCPLTMERINYDIFYTMELYIAIGINDLQLNAKTWVNLNKYC